MITRKKLIEVALPLDAINTASAREKSIRHGHPSTLHLWWARRPLAAARAVIFAQLVDDPSSRPELFPTEAEQERERQRLFRLMEQLVLWENTTNEDVLRQAREEIWQSWRRTCADNAYHPRAAELFDPERLPAFHDPFAGGGSLPLEAQRLGLEAYASDLNPVAVLINKAMIEIPPKFANMPPVNPEVRSGRLALDQQWRGAQGLAEDVRYYGRWMRDEAQRRIGHLYPPVEVTAEMADNRPDLAPYVGRTLTVIAWLWARTVKSPNPAFAHVDVPLASTFMLSTKPGKEAYVHPIIEGDSYRFEVLVGKPQTKEDQEAAKNGTKLARANFACILSGMPISAEYIRAEAQAGRMGSRLMTIVAAGDRERVYLAPTLEHEAIAKGAVPEWKPELKVPTPSHDVDRLPMYGMPTWGDAFTLRQLVALATLSNLIGEVFKQVYADAVIISRSGDTNRFGGEVAANAYAEAITLYLALAIGKFSDNASMICSWHNGAQHQKIRATFSRQVLPMTWDFAEGNTFSDSTGNFFRQVELIEEVISKILPANVNGNSIQSDAQQQFLSQSRIVSTDPPYFDNIMYSDLSDFFYVWLRRSLRTNFTSLFATMAVPKDEELVAAHHRHGGKEKAEKFFLDGMTKAMMRVSSQSHPSFPVTIYYAFKQAETDKADGTSSTGWETFLGAVIQAGFGISGTWPMRTELGNRMIGFGTNALASSIVLVCRPRPKDALAATRREFVAALKEELPEALMHLQRGNIAPVDLAQAAIGPGMAVFTRYRQVLDASGTALSVREALALINQILDEVLAEQEGDFDADTRWALAWFDQHGFADGPYGVAETLSKAKNTSVGGMVEAGLIASKAGSVRLLRPEELPADWNPAADTRLTVWEMTHHLVRAHQGGEAAAAALAARIGPSVDVARELAYRLYTVCERKKRAQEALAYNSLVQSWPEIVQLSREQPAERPAQMRIDM